MISYSARTKYILHNNKTYKQVRLRYYTGEYYPNALIPNNLFSTVDGDFPCRLLLWCVMNVKRETWNGKFIVVGRLNGKLVSWKKYNPKVTIAEDKKTFSRDYSFNKDVKRKLLTKQGKPSTFEVSDTRRRQPIREGQTNQLFVTIKVGNRSVTARSLSFTTKNDPNIARHRREVEEDAYRRLSEAYGGEYDADEGRKILRRLQKNNKVKITHGSVRYARA